MSDEVLAWLLNVNNRVSSSIYTAAARILDNEKAHGIEEFLDQSYGSEIGEVVTETISECTMNILTKAAVY